MIGQNMWSFFPELKSSSGFIQLRANTDKGVDSNFVTISPLTAQRLHITGHALNDCYIFTSSILPKREEMMEDLRQQLKKKRISS